MPGGVRLQSVGTHTRQPSASTPPAREPADRLGIDVPESLAPVVVVSVATGAQPSDVPAPARDTAWRRVTLSGSGRHGADLKEAFREGLRAGGRCIVVWPSELAEREGTIPRLVRPIFTRRADLVLPAFSGEARRAGLRPLPACYLRPLLCARRAFIPFGPTAISRRALDLIPFEANEDDLAFCLQLLAQANHFGLDVSPLSLSPAQYQHLAATTTARAPGLLAQTRCAVEFLAHRWGLSDSQRFQISQMTYVSRWMVTKHKI